MRTMPGPLFYSCCYITYDKQDLSNLEMAGGDLDSNGLTSQAIAISIADQTSSKIIGEMDLETPISPTLCL